MLDTLNQSEIRPFYNSAQCIQLDMCSRPLVTGDCTKYDVVNSFVLKQASFDACQSMVLGLGLMEYGCAS